MVWPCTRKIELAFPLVRTPMPLFWKPYKSDVTRLIEELTVSNPTLKEEQRQGRALLWDKTVDRDAQVAYRATKVPQQAYVYQTHR